MDVKLSPDKMLLGGNLTDGDTAEFLVWAPFAKRVHLELISPTERMVRMKPLERGYHGLVMDDVGAGARYFYRLNSRQTAEPTPLRSRNPTGSTVRPKSSTYGTSGPTRRGEVWR